MRKKNAPALAISRLKATGLLSFGPSGIDLPLHRLNVLIGANGSGKSNLVDLLSVLRAAPVRLRQPIDSTGGVANWLWKGSGATSEGLIECEVDEEIRHSIRIRETNSRMDVASEEVTVSAAGRGKAVRYQSAAGSAVFSDNGTRSRIDRSQINPEESILAQFRDPSRYPTLARLVAVYSKIEIFRTWSFGPHIQLRQSLPSHGRTNFLDDGGGNLAPVLSSFRGDTKAAFTEFLRKAYPGIHEVGFEIQQGAIQLYLDEDEGVRILSSRLSDGTLRYLCLLAILLHPNPPRLIALEEPELGLHPDLMPVIADLLIGASSRTQLIVTTHSRNLVDALSSCPEAVVVCERQGRESRMERLDAARLSHWLDKYSLGELWSSGEIGGNRW